MSELVFPKDNAGSLEFKEWLAEHHGHEADVFPENAYGYGIKNGGGEIVVAVVVQPFHYPGDILVQYFASDPKIFFQKELIFKSFMMPFNPPINARRLTLVINGIHDRSIGVAKRMGFREEGRMPFHFGENEAVILGMVRPDLEV
jgi:hypothetical protein